MVTFSFLTRAPQLARLAKPAPPPVGSWADIQGQLAALLKQIQSLVGPGADTTGTFLPKPRAVTYQSVGDDPKPVDEKTPIDLRLHGWPVRNQLEEDTCVPFAVIACMEFLRFQREGDLTPLSPQYLLDCIKRMTRDRDKASTSTYLRWAYDALKHEGVQRESVVPYVGGGQLVTEPTACQLETAIRCSITVFYRDQPYKTEAPRPADVLYGCLARKYPVAVGLPVFFDENADTPRQTNWSTPDALHHGFVREPTEGLQPIAKHAVCVTGFIPSASEPSGGYFVFRNSFGTRWAGFAPSTLTDGTAPQPGYGVVSVGYINQYCTELLQLT